MFCNIWLASFLQVHANWIAAVDVMLQVGEIIQCFDRDVGKGEANQLRIFFKSVGDFFLFTLDRLYV